MLVHLYSIQEHRQGKRLFKCRHCDKAFAQNCNLWDHIRMHTGEKPFTCSRCGKSSSQKSHLKNHMRIHTGENSILDYSTFYIDLIYHPILEHTLGRNHISEPKVAKLLHILVHLYSIQEHRQGKRLLKCRHCDKAFAQNCNLWDHIRMHTGEKPFTSSRWGKSSSQKSHLKKHMRNHTGENSILD